MVRNSKKAIIETKNHISGTAEILKNINNKTDPAQIIHIHIIMNSLYSGMVFSKCWTKGIKANKKNTAIKPEVIT